jgi:hypothetical protein
MSRRGKFIEIESRILVDGSGGGRIRSDYYLLIIY